MRICLLSFICVPLFLFAQTDSSKVKRVTKLETGYMFGGIINLNYFASNGAYAFSVGHGVRIIDQIQLIPSVGVERYQDGVLFPFYLDVNAYPNKNKRGFFDVKLGYSAGTNNRSVINIDYRYRGGAVFSVGYGADLYKSEKIKLTLAVSYNLRNAQITYRPFDDEERISSKFSYHLVGGRLAAIF